MKFGVIFFTICVAVVLLSGLVESRPDGEFDCSYVDGVRVCKPKQVIGVSCTGSSCRPDGTLQGVVELAKKTGKEIKRVVKKIFG